MSDIGCSVWEWRSDTVSENEFAQIISRQILHTFNCSKTTQINLIKGIVLLNIKIRSLLLVSKKKHFRTDKQNEKRSANKKTVAESQPYALRTKKGL